MTRRSRRAAAVAVPAAFAVVALAAGQQAVAVPDTDFPTWDEVEAARGDQATAQAEVDKIEGILVRLEQEAAELGTVALQRGEEYALAQDALAEATAKVDRIRTQAEAAEQRAEDSEQRIAALVAQLARSGGGDVTIGLLLGSGGSADKLLARLGIVQKLGDSSAALLDRAIYDKKTAEALAADSRAAERERRKLATAAEDAYEVAEAAAREAEEAAAAQRADVDRMYAQLAVLKGTSEDLERAYQEGLQAEGPAAPDPAAPPAPPATPPPPPPPTAPPVDPTPPPPSTSAVETAIAFATAQLGDRYELGGSGPDAWDCSGLTKASYGAAGVYIGTHSATNQYNTAAAAGRLVTLDQLRRGDLLFWSAGGSVTATKYHVAIYLGNGLMIEAPRPGAPVRIVAVRSGDLVPYGARPTG